MSSENDSDLWMIVAIIQRFKLDAVTLALEQLPGFGGMTVSACRGFGAGKVRGDSRDSDGGQVPREHRPEITEFKDQLRLEIAVVSRSRANTVCGVIADAAHTGRSGDGKIFLWPMARAVGIRNFDEGVSAL